MIEALIVIVLVSFLGSIPLFAGVGFAMIVRRWT